MVTTPPAAEYHPEDAAYYAVPAFRRVIGWTSGRIRLAVAIEAVVSVIAAVAVVNGRPYNPPVIILAVMHISPYLRIPVAMLCVCGATA